MRLKTIFYILPILLTLIIVSGWCRKPVTQLILQDVHYGSDSLQTMDIYLTENRTVETPLVVLVHGGGWMAGDKKDAGFMKDACFANEINVVNINYRLGTPDIPGIHYKEMMADIDSAMSYVLDHASEWNIRKSKYIFWGGSAGAHLSLLYAYNYDTRDIISLVITLGAPTRFDAESMKGAKPGDIQGLLPLITGKPWNNDPELLDEAYKDASPYFGKNLKPSFLIHGEKDDIVPKQQSIMMSELLKQKNIVDTLVILPNGGHGGENTPQEVSERLNLAMYQWIIRYSR